MSAEFTNESGVKAGKAMKDAVEKYQKTLVSSLAKNIEVAAIFVEGEAKRNIKKFSSEEGKLIDTGRMINSLAHVTEESKDEVVGIVGSNLYYYPFQELGTSTIPPRPTLRPALSENLDAVNKLIKDGVNIAARKVDKG